MLVDTRIVSYKKIQRVKREEQVDTYKIAILFINNKTFAFDKHTLSTDICNLRIFGQNARHSYKARHVKNKVLYTCTHTHTHTHTMRKICFLSSTFLLLNIAESTRSIR